MEPLNTTFMQFKDWSDVLFASFQNLGLKVVDFLPVILSALVVLLLGLIIASILRRVAQKITRLVRLDSLMSSLGAEQELSNLGFKMKFSKLIGLIVKWFVIIATLIAVADILHVPQISQFLERIVLYIPNVLVAVIILAIGIIASRFVFNLTKRGMETAKLSSYSADILGRIGKWAIIVFTVMAALVQLGVGSDLIQILFTGLVFMFALAGGLAFGLGGRQKASEIIDKLSKEERE